MSTKINSSQLSSQQLAAIPLLVSGMRGKDVAAKLSVTEETVSRWRRDPLVVAAMNGLQADAHESAKARLRHLLGSAIDCIDDALQSASPLRTRIEAAKLVLSFTKVEEVSEIAVGSQNPASVKDLQALQAYALQARLQNVINGKG